MLTWGWIRWITQLEKRTTVATLSLIGFLLASVSALVAVSWIVLVAVQCFFTFDPLRPFEAEVFRMAKWLSLAGIVFGIGGAWRRSLLRWHSLVSAIGITAFWTLLEAIHSGGCPWCNVA